jgi:hypothetical protein
VIVNGLIVPLLEAEAVYNVNKVGNSKQHNNTDQIIKSILVTNTLCNMCFIQ